MNLKSTFLLIQLLILSFVSRAQTPCINGMAGSYPCANIDLLSHLSTDDLLAEEQQGILLNDIWGWTDSDTGKEYVIIGMANGTSFVDISDPLNPVMLGILPEHHQALSGRSSNNKMYHDGAKSIWRDIKVYNNHAFIVSEDVGHGMQVFDLTDLRNVIDTPVEFKEAGHYDGISNAHNIVINEETGFAYAVGATGSTGCADGGLHIINIKDPKIPVFEACFDNDGYTHDAQCVIYNGPDSDYQGKEICFNSNEDTITIVDVDDKGNMQQISRTGYDGSSYTHQGWLTEDHQYFLSNDELDEKNRGVNTTTMIWDVRDLDAPVLIGSYVHSTNAIDHNLYVVGNSAYESNYTSGLRILDITNVAEAQLSTLAFFDTYPPNDDAQFAGTWSNYPFFESGVIAVSDITNGLFLLKMQNEIEISVLKQPNDLDACMGDHFDLSIEAIGENLSYRWQLNTGSGFEDITDYVAYNNTFSKSLHIHEVDFSQNEYQFRCKLTDSGGNVSFTNTSTLRITDNPIADFEFFNVENVVTFTNLSNSATNYVWYFGDKSSVNFTESPEHIYAFESLEYDVTLKALNDCAFDEITKTLNLVVTGVDDYNDQSIINLFPVPASNQITIETNILDNFKTYSIYSSNGKIVKSGTLKLLINSIDVSELKRGLYVIEFKSEKRTTVNRRILIE